MKKVEFWISEEEHKEAIRKIVKHSNKTLYGFAKEAFLEALKNVGN